MAERRATRNRDEEDDEEEEEERPRRSSSRRAADDDDEEEEKPRSRRARDEEEDEEDDDEDEDRPRQKVDRYVVKNINFKGVEAIRGSTFQWALVEHGPYLMVVTDVFADITSNKNHRVTARARIIDDLYDGEFVDKEVQTQFTPVPMSKPKDNPFATGRYRGMLEAFGKKVPDGRIPEMDLRDLKAIKFVGHCSDKEIPGSDDGKYKARMVSDIVAFDPAKRWDEIKADALPDQPAAKTTKRSAKSRTEDDEEEETPPAKSERRNGGSAATTTRRRAEPEEDEEEEEERKPARAASSRRSAVTTDADDDDDD